MPLSKIDESSWGGTQLGGRRNLLINPLFKVNQRGVTSVSATSGNQKFTADRWLVYTSGLDYTATIQEVTLPDGTKVNSHKTTADTSTTSGFFHPYQKVEANGLEYLQGKTVVLSAWVRTNVAGQYMRICDTVGCHLLGDELPSDGEWHFVQATHTMPTTMNTGSSSHIQYQPIFESGLVINAGDYAEFALPQFEVGSQATPFEVRSFSEDFNLCQRFYQVVHQRGNASTGTYYSYYNRFYGNQVQFTPMRATPSISYQQTGGAFYWVDPGVNAYSGNSTSGFDYSCQMGENKWGTIEFSQVKPAGGSTPTNFSSYRLEASIDFILDAEF